VLVALKSEPIDALWVLLFLVAYQQFENYVLGPRVTKRTMDVHPALAIGTVFAGGLLLGGVGAVLALPATAVIQAVISQRMPKQEVLEVPLTADPSAEPASSRRTRRRVRRRGSRSRRAGAPRATR
jgi:predicted PurR-regulated permease PerM